MSFGFNMLTINLKKVLNKAYEVYLSYSPDKSIEIRFNEDGGGFGVGGLIGVKFTKFLLTNVPPNSTFYITQAGKSSIYENCDDTNSCGTALGEIYPDASVENSEYIDISNNENIDFINDLVNMYDVQGVIHGANYFGFPAGTDFVPFEEDNNNDQYELDYDEVVGVDCIVDLFASIPSTINAPIESFGYDEILDKLQLMLSCSIMPFFLHLLQYMSFSLLYQRMIYMVSLGLYIPRVGKYIPKAAGSEYPLGYISKKNIEMQELNNPFTLLITQPPSYEDGTVPAYIADFVNVIKHLVESVNNTNNRKLDILINSFGVASDVNGYDTKKFRNILNYQIELQTEKGSIDSMISVDSIEESINTIVD